MYVWWYFFEFVEKIDEWKVGYLSCVLRIQVTGAIVVVAVDVFVLFHCHVKTAKKKKRSTWFKSGIFHLYYFVDIMISQWLTPMSWLWFSYFSSCNAKYLHFGNFDFLVVVVCRTDGCNEWQLQKVAMVHKSFYLSCWHFVWRTLRVKLCIGDLRKSNDFLCLSLVLRKKERERERKTSRYTASFEDRWGLQRRIWIWRKWLSSTDAYFSK